MLEIAMFYGLVFSGIGLVLLVTEHILKKHL